jgi:hypothetical protein
MSDNGNKNNGLITKIWGPPMWDTLHSISFGYPINPSKEQKVWYYNYYSNIMNVLPCKFCRQSVAQFVQEPETKLDMSIFKNRDSLTRWVYRLHQRVNKKLGVDYGVTFEDIRDKYESRRAKCPTKKEVKKLEKEKKPKGCTMPLNLKANSYQIANKKECPIIEKDLAKQFQAYARLRGLDEASFPSNPLCIQDGKGTVEWDIRNDICRKQITKMRCEGLKSIEESGEYKGLLTIDELKLVGRLSTTLSKSELENIAKKTKKIIQNGGNKSKTRMKYFLIK